MEKMEDKMGTWGTGIYSNDIADDVREACKDIFAAYDVQEGNERLFQEFKDIVEQSFVDNEYASFWYALADWQWKHGMLTEFVKNKTLDLLSSYAGLDEWLEAGDKSAVAKRRKVLDSLKTQLSSQQAALKKPRLTLAKPKHKPGDIIVFQATEFVDEWDSVWHIEGFSWPLPLVFSDELISRSSNENINGYDAHGKYMAVLCVGTQKEVHSQYIPDAFDEYSIYVWHDYLSEKKPDVTQLRLCGFLPMVDFKFEDFNKGTISSISWTYQFAFPCENFRDDPYIRFERERITDENEVTRYKQLLSQKSYSSDLGGGRALSTSFSTAFQEKNRMELLGKPIDNLLDRKTTNPEFLPIDEINKRLLAYFADAQRRHYHSQEL